MQSLHNTYTTLIQSLFTQSLHEPYTKPRSYKAYTKLVQSLCKAYTQLAQNFYKAHTEHIQSAYTKLIQGLCIKLTQSLRKDRPKVF